MRIVNVDSCAVNCQLQPEVGLSACLDSNHMLLAAHPFGYLKQAPEGSALTRLYLATDDSKGSFFCSSSSPTDNEDGNWESIVSVERGAEAELFIPSASMSVSFSQG